MDNGYHEIKEIESELKKEIEFSSHCDKCRDERFYKSLSRTLEQIDALKKIILGGSCQKSYLRYY